jgi:hypothetical protein
MSGTSSYSKWAPIIDSDMGTASDPSRKSWLAQYANMHSLNANNIGTASSMNTFTSSSFPSILSIAKKAFTQTIAQNLVSVQPMSGPMSGPTLFMDYIYNTFEIYNSILQKVERYAKFGYGQSSFGVEIKDELIKIGFIKDCDIDFYEIKYAEKQENNISYIYTISFNKFVSEKYQDICEYSIIEVTETDWKSFSRDKKIDGILD